MDDDSRAWRWESRTDLPLAIASLIYLAAYAVHVLVPGLPAAVDLALRSVQLLAWALFVADYAVRWRLSGMGPRFVARHWLDTLVVLLPLMRPLRSVRTQELVERRHGRTQLPLHARVIVYTGLSAVLVGFAGALAVYQQERGAPHATIRTFGDSVWWACSTLATVGYGDVAPVTFWGRTIAVVLMICGLGLLGAVTGSFSTLLLQRFSREADEEGPPGR
ncbi:two pore domain potassium channel family protein [Streptomyces sp. SID486]|uniref:ion channel n=1 Tax=unclassified Streptomyces TaxID=2593676 RepID=UPI001369FAD2|nr:two pore domain potassium channel family protein [Streptomyces sp. SID2955]MYW48043.1 two pore domain potassium channel family protein [Streptomyces sp. SID161]MYX96583.1 two pore domain potassium channel family protein [Streptomyces sp. SID486]